MKNIAQRKVIDPHDVMRESLSRYNAHFLTVFQFAENTYALYKKGKRESVSLTPEQKNIIDWYNTSIKEFAYPKRPDGKVIHPPLEQIQRIREIEKMPNHFLKVVIEMILNYVLREELKKEVANGNISLYSTSSYDDIFGGVDGVIGYDTIFAGRTMRCYLGVDYCVTSNTRYVEAKTSRSRMTNLKEFNFMTGQNENLIPRIIKAFDPYIISNLYTYALLAISQGKKVDFSGLYNSIKNSSQNPLIKTALATSGIVSTILER